MKEGMSNKQTVDNILAAVKQGIDEGSATARGRIAELEAKLRESEARAAGLREELDNTRKRAKHLEDSCAEYERRAEAKSKQIQDAFGHFTMPSWDRGMALEAENKRLREEIEMAIGQRDEAEARADRLGDELRSTLKENRRFEATREENKQLRAALEAAEREWEIARLDNDRAHIAMAAASEAIRAVEGVNAKLRGALETIAARPFDIMGDCVADARKLAQSALQPEEGSE